MDIGSIRDPRSGEVFADVDDLIALFKDAQGNPEKYNQNTISQLAEETMGKKQEPVVERPF